MLVWLAHGGLLRIAAAVVCRKPWADNRNVAPIANASKWHASGMHETARCRAPVARVVCLLADDPAAGRKQGAIMMMLRRFLAVSAIVFMGLGSVDVWCQTPAPPLATGKGSIGAINAAGSSGFVDIYYTDSAGNPIGEPEKHVPVDDQGNFVLKPTKAQGAKGNKIQVEDNNPVDRTVYRRYIIETAVTKTMPPTLVILSSAPEPGKQSPMSLGPLEPEVIRDDPVFGIIRGFVVASNFDLMYTSLGGSDYDVTIVGDNSFMLLNDETYLDFADGSLFGRIQITPQVAMGVFDFFGIGMSGTWAYDAVSGRTTTSVTNYSAFSAPAISVIAEPSSLLLVLAALGVMGAVMPRRYSQCFHRSTHGLPKHQPL